MAGKSPSIDAILIDDQSSDTNETRKLSALQSSQAKLVYLALIVSSGATVNELRVSLQLPALSLYPTLEFLIERNFVEHDGEAYLTTTETES